MGERALWIDARMGVAGDMLLGALLDAGADLEMVRRHVEAVLPGVVRLTSRPAVRGGMSGTRLDVVTVREDHPHRPWRDIREMLLAAELPDRIRRDAPATFAALAEAEGRVHGVEADDVEFHEVGAWDSIADVVGVCAALTDLGVDRVLTSPIAVGDGFVTGAHGVLPVPVPAVLRLLEGSRLTSQGVPAATYGQVGELATPTGVALLVALAEPVVTLPPGIVRSVGVGAGAKDGLPWPNITRVIVLDEETEGAPPSVVQPGAIATSGQATMHVVEANVDDFDPRLWPGVVAALMAAGAADAWLTPIVMKKGRPAHTLTALVVPDRAPAIRDEMLRRTSTLGVRESTVRRHALARTSVPVEVELGGRRRSVRLTCAHADGRIVRVTPEFEDLATLARETGSAEIDALTAAIAAAHTAGLVVGEPMP